MDRISNLPDELICHIGSFLSADDAASAMVLSKRWRYLFTIVPGFFSRYMNKESFTDFTNEIIALPLDSRIGKFAITWGFECIEPADMDCCLSHALKHGVVDLKLLDVTVHGKEGDKYSLPLEVFTCETVAKLSLLGKSIPAKAYLPSLKILKFHYVRIYELDMLLSACPLLEELLIYDFREWKGPRPRSVSSQTMKRLTLNKGYDVWGYYDEPEFKRISFDTPALTYLDYKDFARKEYPIVNLSSLVEAKLRIYKEEGTLPDPINFFHGLKNIKILSVADKTMELIHDFQKAIPMFENLSHLTLVNKEKCCWSGLPVLLQKSPKLKTLTIKGYLHRDKFDHFEPLCECLLGYSFLLTCRIEVLKITKFKGSIGEMSQLKHVLEKLQYLELLEIRIMAGNEDEELKIKKDLLTIPRASAKCKITPLCF